ncbi:MAG: hypothetical protein DCC68_11320 [Planctomycetota bacterium]|nr:MAG: hypothetical protein DCC68_11320 [Planctomycetota bacterium]
MPQRPRRRVRHCTVLAVGWGAWLKGTGDWGLGTGDWGRENADAKPWRTVTWNAREGGGWRQGANAGWGARSPAVYSRRDQ